MFYRFDIVATSKQRPTTSCASWVLKY